MAASTAKRCLLACLGLCALGAAYVFWPTAVADPQDRDWTPRSDLSGGIVVLGTSLSHGDWPQEMGSALRTCGLGVGDVTQITKPGANSEWGVSQLEAVIAAAPALVLIEFAINDADLRDGLSKSESRAQHELIAGRLTEALPEASLVFMTMSPARGLRGALRPFLAGYYAITREVAAESGAGLIDLYPRWRAFLAQNGAGEALPDGLHPTVTAKVALPVIVEQIAQTYGGGLCNP